MVSAAGLLGSGCQVSGQGFVELDAGEEVVLLQGSMVLTEIAEVGYDPVSGLQLNQVPL